MLANARARAGLGTCLLFLWVTAGHSEEAPYGHLDFSRVPKGDEKVFWDRLDYIAMGEALLRYCGRSQGFEQKAEDGIRACVTKEALQRAKVFFDSKVDTYLAYYKSNGQSCRSDPVKAHPYLGIDAPLPDGHNDKHGVGVVVARVTQGYPADKAGIKPGDVIVSVNGEEVLDYEQLGKKIDAVGIGRSTSVEYTRDGVRKAVRVTLAYIGYNSKRRIVFDAAPAIGYYSQDLQHVAGQVTELCNWCKNTLVGVLCR
jgi:hypothetical protein